MKMNYADSDRDRDIVTFGGTEYQIHDIAFNGESYPRFPFALYTPYIVYSSGQLHSYLDRYFAALRQCKMENISLYGPSGNLPYPLYCGISLSPHIIGRPMTHAMLAHFSTGRVRIHHWTPLLNRPSTKGSFAWQS